MATNVSIKISAYEKEERRGRVVSGWLALTAFVTCFGSSMLMGYNIGVLNSPTKIIVGFYNETYSGRGAPPDDSVLELLWTVTVSVFVAVAMVGAFCTGPVADRLGRKRGLLLNHGVMLLGVLLESLTKLCAAPELLILGRAAVGFSSGLTMGLASLFLTEISPTSVRGAVGSCHQLAVTVGILLAQVLGLTEILGTASGWPWLLAVSSLPAALAAMLLPLCPESPRYLLLNKGDAAAAREALQRLRTAADVSVEMDEMVREAKESAAASAGGGRFGLLQLLRQRDLRMPLLVVVVMQLAQMWSGINCIFFYSESIFESAGVPAASIPYAIVATGVINVLTTVASVQLIERLGRRSLLIYPMCLMAVATVVITIALNMQAHYKWMSYLSIACVVLFIIGFALGLGSITQLLCSELFRQEPRPTAMGLAQGVNWTSNFLLTTAFRAMQKSLSTYVFLVFLAVLLASIVFIFFFVPETKNRTFDEIARDLQQGVSGMIRSRSSTAFLLSRNNTPACELTHMARSTAGRNKTESEKAKEQFLKPLFQV